jgi:uncharacterized protein
MLRVDIRELRKGPVETTGALAPGADLFEGLGLALEGPLEVTGSLELTGRNDYLWHGQLAGRVQSTCRRCDREFVSPVDVSIEALFSGNPDLQDDPSVYPLVEPVTHVDVTAAVREELALAVPPFPLCREECAGLCQNCGADLNQGPCGCASPAPHH